MSRRNDRKHALCLVFALDFDGDKPLYDHYCEFFAMDAVEKGIGEPEYVQKVIRRVERHMDKIDNVIARHAEGWDFGRLSRIDKAIMRLAICEMLYIDNITPSIAINEAVELAKEYSMDDAPKFINGILGKVARNIHDVERDDEY